MNKPEGVIRHVFGGVAIAYTVINSIRFLVFLFPVKNNIVFPFYPFPQTDGTTFYHLSLKHKQEKNAT